MKIPEEEKPDSNGSVTKPDRRSFMKDAAVAGLVGAVAMAPSLTQPVEAAQQRVEVQDPPKPEGLKPTAEPDSRFPVFYQSSVPEGVKLLTQYFLGLSQ